MPRLQFDELSETRAVNVTVWCQPLTVDRFFVHPQFNTDVQPSLRDRSVIKEAVISVWVWNELFDGVRLSLCLTLLTWSFQNRVTNAFANTVTVVIFTWPENSNFMHTLNHWFKAFWEMWDIIIYSLSTQGRFRETWHKKAFIATCDMMHKMRRTIGWWTEN